MEYILVLVVVVGIALGVTYQLNSALKKYVQSYFGDYISCLLETGELPGLGGTSGANADTCDALYEPFSLKNGRPLIASSGGNGDGDGNNNSSRSGRGNSGARVTRNSSSLNADRNPGNQVVAGTVGDKSKKELQVGGGGEDTSSSFSTKARRGEYGGRLYTKLKTDPKEKVLNKKIDLQGKISGRNARKIAVDMDKFKPKKQTSDTSLGLSFGDYIRYLLIFAILVVILIFFGGQVNQLRKSWEN